MRTLSRAALALALAAAPAWAQQAPGGATDQAGAQPGAPAAGAAPAAPAAAPAAATPGVAASTTPVLSSAEAEAEGDKKFLALDAKAAQALYEQALPGAVDEKAKTLLNIKVGMTALKGVAEADQKEKAKKSFEAALALEHQNAMAHWGMGWFLFLTGAGSGPAKDKLEMSRHLAAAVELNPTIGLFHYARVAADTPQTSPQRRRQVSWCLAGFKVVPSWDDAWKVCGGIIEKNGKAADKAAAKTWLDDHELVVKQETAPRSEVRTWLDYLAESAKPVAVAVEGGAEAGRAPEEPPPPIERPMRVKTHKEAKDWEPVSVRFVGGVDDIESAFSRRVVIRKVKGKKVQKGEPSRVTAAARLHRLGEDKLIIVSLYPESLKKAKTFLEVRLKIVEGYLEGAQVAAVTIEDAAVAARHDEDSVTLRRKSLPFREEYPSSAELKLAAIDPAPGKHTANAGILSGAEFGGRELGFVTARYLVRGLAGEGGAAASKAPKKPRRKRR